MSEQIQKTESKLPEQLEAARLVGQIPASEFPWLTEAQPGDAVNVSELTFADGRIFVASAVPKRLEKITEIARSQDPKLADGEQYSRTDKLLLMAAHIEASGQSLDSGRISRLRGDISPLYNDYEIGAYKESPKPNTRRMYYAYTSLSETGFKSKKGADVDKDAPLMVRLCWTDKKHQLDSLKVLTTHTVGELRERKVGS